METEETVPFPRRCTACRRLYARVRTTFGSWNQAVFPAAGRRSLDEDAAAPAVPDDVVALAGAYPAGSRGPCKTAAIPVDVVRAIAASLGVTTRRQEAAGGMGRVFALSDPDRVLKISDATTSWSAFEPRAYAVLRERDVPCVRLVGSVSHPPYVAMVLDRAEVTLTAIVRAAARVRPDSARSLARAVRPLLAGLRAAGLVFGDLSPDNVMLAGADLVLIDPQFLVDAAAFRRRMGEARAHAFDTVYLALKIQAIGFVDVRAAAFARELAGAVLGREAPADDTAARWLLREAPVGLFLAYDINLGAPGNKMPT